MTQTAIAPREAGASHDVNRWHRDARRQRAREFCERIAQDRQRWRRRNWFYHREVERFCQSVIPPGARVLELGCGSGDLLAALKPSDGVGIDWSQTCITQARARHPHLTFLVDDAEELQLRASFDYVVLSGLLGLLIDVQRALEQLHRVCHRHTRIVITDYSYLWEPVLRVAQAVGLALKQPPQNWLPIPVITQVLELAGFQVIRTGGRVLLPFPIPFVSAFVNRILARLPGLNRLCLVATVIARPRWPAPEASQEPRPSCSVVVPCRNEEGTIEALVSRIPEMGSRTEILFVDGHSTDQTVSVIERMIREHPERSMTLFVQDGTGKGNAVRQGLARADGEVLMTLDADMTVAPEELPKFYNALVNGQGELINGTRLIYPMDGQAMQMLNVLGNKAFSLLFTYLLGQKLHDTLCGTKAFWRRDYERIAAGRHLFRYEDPFGDFDLLLGAVRLNLQIIEVPVRYTERVYGRTNIRRFAHGWQLLKVSWVAMKRLTFSP